MCDMLGVSQIVTCVGRETLVKLLYYRSLTISASAAAVTCWVLLSGQWVLLVSGHWVLLSGHWVLQTGVC